MDARILGSALLIWAAAATVTLAQQAPAQGGDAGRAPSNAIGNAVEREVKGLTAEDFPERQAAVQRLEALIAEQVKQRAAVQDIVDALQKDLAKQQQALAMVTDEEAQAQVAGLLEMERGLASFTIQTMGETPERRQALLAWGLSKAGANVVARVYAQNKRTRLAGIQALAKIDDEAAGWTLGRLVNDEDDMIRASAMSVAWGRKPQSDVVAALWFRAITGPQHVTEMEHMGRGGGDNENSIKVEFPEGEPMEFFQENDANGFTDAELAGDVLAHIHSPMVESKVKALVADRAREGKSLASMEDPDWTLVTHRLVEAYMVKEAIPLLANEALSAQSEDMGGDFQGRPYMWSQRTMAIGVLCKLIGKDPGDFGLIRARDTGDTRGWQWGSEMNVNAMNNGNGQADGPAVRAFFAWWKDHHAENGVKEEPSGAGVPRERQPGRGRGGRPIPVPTPAGEAVPGVEPGAPGVGGPAIDVAPATPAVPDAPPAEIDPPNGDGPVRSVPMRPFRGRGAG